MYDPVSNFTYAKISKKINTNSSFQKTEKLSFYAIIMLGKLVQHVITLIFIDFSIWNVRGMTCHEFVSEVKINIGKFYLARQTPMGITAYAASSLNVIALNNI